MRKHLLPPLAREECSVDEWKVPEGAARDILERRVTDAIIREGKVDREQSEKKFDNFDASGLDARLLEMMDHELKVPRRNDGGIVSWETFHISPLEAHPICSRPTLGWASFLFKSRAQVKLGPKSDIESTFNAAASIRYCSRDRIADRYR